MQTNFLRALAFILLAGLLICPPAGSAPSAQADALAAPDPGDLEPRGPQAGPAGAAQQSIPIFRFPVVPGATTGGSFDHQPAERLVVLYDGRSNPHSNAGFQYSCSNPWMSDWVGCQDAVSGEIACSNSRELWYDNHRGIDYEFSPNWHTGAVCDPGRFSGLTMPIHSPARGQVLVAGYDPYRPGNGWHIRLKHDLNGNGNFDDDNFRSVYLHFTANSLAVWPGQIVEEGQYLGLGGSTGYSSSPHLHFEVQRSSDYFQTTVWSVDPYGWQGSFNDPWPYTNVRLFRDLVDYSERAYLPMVAYNTVPCTNCIQLVSNGSFESGHTAWVENGTQLIARVGEPNLRVTPHQGSWLGWLGGIVNRSDQLYQDILIPNGAREGVLTYYLNVVSNDTGGKDMMYVNLYNPGGGLIRQLDYADNNYSPKNSWVQRSVTIDNLANWQGQTVRLSFETSNNEVNQTSFYIDTISFITTVP